MQIVVPIVEVTIIAILLNYLLSFFWNTRAMDLALGFLAVLLLFLVSSWLHFPVLQKILVHVVEVAVLAVIVIFQPELRMALSRLSFKGRKQREINEFDQFLEHLTNSVYRLSEKRVGALIVLQNQDSLSEYTKNAVLLQARFSSELLESIFMTTTPLHDGAVIVRNTQITAAAVILPLADDHTQLTRTLGTRHRAGLGISQLTDAITIVISEESGRVSVAREGIMTRGIKIDRFKGILRSVFTHPVVKTRTKLWGWLPQ